MVEYPDRELPVREELREGGGGEWNFPSEM